MIKKWYIDLINKKRILVAIQRGIAIIQTGNVVLNLELNGIAKNSCSASSI
jgi:hypothetical protein